MDGPKHQTMSVDSFAGGWAVDSSVWSVRRGRLGILRRGHRPAEACPDQSPRVHLDCHDDAAAVSRLRDVLRGNGIEVIVDSEAMLPGERISDFIDRSIRDCDVVVSVVSDRSLLSAWVASETVLSFSRLKRDPNLSFVACYLDDAWLQPEFRLQITQRIDDRLRRIESLLPDYAAQRIDSADLNEEKTRLYDLRNNLGHLLAVLRERSVSISVRHGSTRAVNVWWRRFETNNAFCYPQLSINDDCSEFPPSSHIIFPELGAPSPARH